MAGQAGKNILIKQGVGDAATTIGGMRTKSMTLNREQIDTTDSDSPSLMRELLEGGGVASMAVTGSGVFKGSAGEKACVAEVLSGAITDKSFIYPGLGTFAGKFQTTQCQLNGEYNGEAQFSLSFESAGLVVFTAEGGGGA